MLGRFPRRWKAPGGSPIELLSQWGVLSSAALLVHCNYLSQKDIELLARSRCSVVYCPRSSHYFGVGEHPWRGLRRRGVIVALGTDSLASSPSLSILDEMRFLANRHPEVSPEELLSMGTLDGARALGLVDKVGALRPGCWADLAVWELPRIGPPQAAEALIQDQLTAHACYVAGRRVRPRSA
jgi:cytosine/adenosine deaminase-related metal-dependent hydrolase